MDVHPSPRTLPPFTSTAGPTPRTKHSKSTLEIFHLFVTVVVLESIVRQTLLFAASKGATFKEFYIEELQAFIGVNIAMGLLKLPQIKDYWCTNDNLNALVSSYHASRQVLHNFAIPSSGRLFYAKEGW